jgi:aspartate kinase
VVVSAIAGVTDELELIYKICQKDKREALGSMHGLFKKHLEFLRDMQLDGGSHKVFEKKMRDYFGQLMVGCMIDGFVSPCSFDNFVSFGEKLSALLLVAAFGKSGADAQLVDSSSVIITDDTFGSASPLFNETEKRVEKVIFPLLMKKIIPVVTGFFGGTKTGKVAILGRGGSDYSATILASVLEAQEVILWKEVDGIYSCDPHKNKDAEFFSELSYAKALELAQNGAKILHPHAMKPVAEKEIVVWIKNTFNPSFLGSKIWKGNI